MKKVRVTGYKTDVTVILDYDNKLQDNCPELKLDKGQDLGVFFRNNRGRYVFESLVYYDKPYTPSEKLEYLQGKNPVIDTLIDEFSLELTV